MMDAEEGDDGNAEAGGGEGISPAMAEAAAAVGIDLAFLQALPAELRGEVKITALSHLCIQESPALFVPLCQISEVKFYKIGIT